MAQVPNSSLPFSDNATNGVIIDQVAWNQMVQVFQSAINDNQSQIVALQNAQATVLVGIGPTYPNNPSNGLLWYRTDLSQLMMYNNGWVIADPAVASSLTIGSTNYPGTTTATANSVALRDAQGNIAANNFSTANNQLDSDGAGTATVKALKINGQPVGTGGYSISTVNAWIG